jgi:hypothetical protein
VAVASIGRSDEGDKEGIMPRTQAQQARADKIKRDRMDDYQERICSLTGLVPSREVRSRGYRGDSFAIVWHLAWYDGQFACGKTWAQVGDLVRFPQKFDIDTVCRSCIGAWARDDKVSRSAEEAKVAELLVQASQVAKVA